MYHVSAQGVDERMINVHDYYYYYYYCYYYHYNFTRKGRIKNFKTPTTRQSPDSWFVSRTRTSPYAQIHNCLSSPFNRALIYISRDTFAL